MGNSAGPRSSAYEVDFAADGVATGMLLGLLFLTDGLVKPTLRGGLTCGVRAGEERCDSSKLNALDRTAVGKRNKDWLLVTDVTLGLLYLGPLLGLAIDSWSSASPTPGTDYGGDLLVVVEAAAAASLVGHLFKYAVRRPRPTQYTRKTFVGSAEHQLSFPSGHATAAAATAAAFATTVALRHPGSGYGYLAGAVGTLLAAVTAYGRVLAGFHFPTDGIAGAVIGGAIGFLLPYLHRHDVQIGTYVTHDVSGHESLQLGLGARW